MIDTVISKTTSSKNILVKRSVLTVYQNLVPMAKRSRAEVSDPRLNLFATYVKEKLSPTTKTQ